MTYITPMFAGWHRKLHGRRPVRNGIEMRSKASEISSLCVRQAKDLFGGLLAIELLTKLPRLRNRTFPLPVVFWAFLCQILADGSCRHAVSSVQSLLSRNGKAICSPSTAAYYKARVRIPIRLLLKIHQRLVAGMCSRRIPRTFVIDGTTISMPDTPANQATWPAVASATYCRKLWRHVRAGDTIVADSGFCCWFTLFLFKQRGVKVVMRINFIRKPDPHAAKLGKGDRLERWRKPNVRPKWIGASDYAKTPNNIPVRVVTVAVDPGSGFRTTELQLASTVLDPEEMAATQIGTLYLERWKAELFIEDLKTTLGMAVLTSRSPAMIRRELLVHIIAYNLLRALMTCGKTVGCENPSFKGTIDKLNHWLPTVLFRNHRNTP